MLAPYYYFSGKVVSIPYWEFMLFWSINLSLCLFSFTGAMLFIQGLDLRETQLIIYAKVKHIVIFKRHMEMKDLTHLALQFPITRYQMTT